MGSSAGRQLFHVKRSVREPWAGGPGVREPEPPAMGPRAGGPESGRPQPEPFRTPPRRRAVSDVFFVYTVFSGSVLVAQARR